MLCALINLTVDYNCKGQKQSSGGILQKSVLKNLNKRNSDTGVFLCEFIRTPFYRTPPMANSERKEK